ncbi:MAG: hypothetical protein A2X34_02510 [Elusimicrobia bacterium GWC2_51_8]|nr:MAG: hypothetical protein A2X33_00885 [Elusimicrobia bacterium GWA2_51_34]OGR60180.1 MAG: hypothetical protein A2X34_02510 [Elusimicrobia bacterium GWC2_51_8]HAF94810.1 hypothetical protein [Elusimicrobiota bacterium]HCE98880.1 hypothetical protein [Elusimicrobiota bacterium]
MASVGMKGFLAYPSDPPHASEIMREAAATINETQLYDIITWQDLTVSGNIIIKSICEAIDDSEIFLCDLTHLNPNVLFELGYAIARKRIIWLMLDPTVADAKKEFQSLEILSTLGYTEYSNTGTLVRRFLDANLLGEDARNKQRLYDQLLTYPADASPGENILFYLKNLHATETSVKISRRVTKSAITQVTDDPKEVIHQTSAWYAQNITAAFAVIANYVAKDRSGANLHNAKLSLISGIAHGLNKKLLMVADAPFQSPIDYRDLLYVAPTSKQAEQYVDRWLNGVEGIYLQDESAWKKYRETKNLQKGLQSLSIGDYVAENEADTLLNYFVPTAAYSQALQSQQTIFIGRKGTGKTATLFKLADEFTQNKENHVCIVKPEGYDFEGLIQVLKANQDRAEAGYLVESLWKYLLYTELIRSAYDELQGQPAFYKYSSEEERLNTFCLDHADIINVDFSSRLDIAVQQLADVASGKTTDKKLHISELLHSKHIGPMRDILCAIFSRTEKVILLIDNLDSAWIAQPSTELGDLLWGLLNVIQSISHDLNRHRKVAKIKLSVVLFLRSDIFYSLAGYAREQDKISFSTLSWNDKDKLINIIDERFKSSLESLRPDQVWSRYFCLSVGSIPIRDYIAGKIIPRPRDIIYLFRNAISEAVARGHAQVEDSDIISAEKKYSQYALESILAEYVAKEFDLEALCFAFVGKSSIIGHSDLACLMRASGILEGNHAKCLSLLIDLSFLGLEVQKDDFRFIYEKSDLRKYEVMAKLYVNETKAEPRYKVNPPFLPYLDMQ